MNQEVFKPVRGTEASILSTIPQKGYVYFAIDTKKIYYSDGESFLPMGGNTGVWYGKMEYAETPEEGQVDFDFSPDEIEGNENIEDGKYSIPNIDDLIFNTPDGCFYRVVEIDSDGMTPQLHCKKLTVAGGGGSSSGGGVGGTGSMTVSRIGDQTINTLQGNQCFIKYKFIAKDAADEETGPGTASLYVGGVLKNTYAAAQGENEIDVGPYLEIGTNSIRLVVSGSIGGTSNISQSKNWTVISTNLSLDWQYDNTIINTADTFTFDWTVSISLEHITHIAIDDLYILDIPSTNSSRNKTYTINRAEWGLTHGSHQVKMYATTTINNTTFTSAPVIHTIICVDEGRNDTIISVGAIANEMNQYDTLAIPIILYNPISDNNKVSAILREDGVTKDNWIDYNNAAQYYWNYTPMTAGSKILTILSGTTEVNIRLTVNSLGVAINEVDGYEFKLKASELISNNNLQNWSQGSIVPTFSEDFDWINGGLKSEKDENGNDRNYISIKAGSSISFNYKPFEQISKTSGFTMKVIFKATECRQYDARILSIGSPEDGNNVYLNLTANEGIYKSSNTTLKIPYCEDSYIEFEVDIWPQDPIKSYIMSWLDGVPTSVSLYDSTDTFIQAPAKNIIIGSNDCDVSIYMIKVYQRHLSNEQHLQNFIADALNATEMLARYNRNNILDDNGEISYNKLIEKNPNCDVYTYEIPRMTKNKKDFVENCTYRRYHGKTNPEQTSDNVTISVQGTSSAAYGLAAYNIDTNFVEGMMDYSNNSTGEHIDSWSMTPNSMPVSYFNTKVNVASCECVNNALNQEWYDRYVPFVTEYHSKNPKVRNTIEFANIGVMFVKDFNKTINDEDGVNNNLFKDTPGYIDKPFYKMYSICNMGNSKKNKEVFTDPTNPYEVIMEVSDNQQPQQQMTSIDQLQRDNNNETFDITTINDNGQSQTTTVFEWRNKPKSNMMVQANNAWLDLVTWFATNNPSAATGEALAQPETYTAYTFKGYTSSRSGYTPQSQILKGTQVTSYAGTYTHDTYERRMAKMLEECEDHLIMDAMVFHFLFIERHTLIDNVAKNTFWHTEDLQHWSMIKDYDNDTADGNDNSGHLTLTYGYEVLDHVHHNENESMVFNASQSVWLHFIEGLLEARTRMYNALDTIETSRDTSSVHGAWKATPYLEKFNEWQSAVPERVWIEDYYRKYLRPWEVYQDATFLPRLEGGKKTHQRKQFEIYQQNYMSTEYLGSESQASIIDIRANGQGVSAHRFPMTVYADSYIRIGAGSGTGNANVRVRAKRGEIYNIQLPVDDTNDMTTYFYLANYITSLKNISALKPKVVNASAAYRLREFSIGSLEEGYVNDGLTTVNLTSNRMLERLEVQNCPNIITSLDLSNSTNLRYLDIRNSGFTGITLAPNAPVETLYLNNPTALAFTNLSKINNFSMEYDRLVTLYLDNIDDSTGINSKTIVANGLYTDENKTTKLQTYSLQNIKWNISNANEITNNKINILEDLLDSSMIPVSIDGTHDRVDKSLALQGTLTITEDAYNSSDSIIIYNRYAIDPITSFINVDIDFEGETAKLYSIEVHNGDNSIVWHNKKRTGYILNEDLYADGPNGALDLDSVLVKSNDTAHVYTFANSWKIYDANSLEEITTISAAEPYYDTPLACDIIIIPEFNQEIRQYTITFMNEENIISSGSYDYGTKINTILPIMNPTKDDSMLNIYETYTFLGYSLLSSAKVPLVFTDDFIVNSDVVYYSIFSDVISVNDSQNVNYENFAFILMEGGYVDEVNSLFNIPKGYAIRPKTGKVLSGKITIPAYYNSLPVISIGGFGHDTNATLRQNEITGIFFENGSLIRVFDQNAFYGMLKLQYLELPDSLRVVDSQACANVSLKLLTKNQLKSDTNYYLGNPNGNLYSLGYYAFNNSIDRDCTTLYVASSISKTSTLGASIANLNNASHLTTIYIGTVDAGSQLDLTNVQKPFRMNSTYPPLGNIYFYVPVDIYSSYSVDTLTSFVNPYDGSTGSRPNDDFTITVLSDSR